MIIRYLKILALGLTMAACNSVDDNVADIGTLPPIVPDCIGVTVPPNIAPLTFGLADSCNARNVVAEFKCADYEAKASGKDGFVAIAPRKWKRLLAGSDSVIVTMKAKVDGKWIAYNPFSIYVAKDSIDSHIAYRLIEPGYEIWNEMGLYQRDLESYDQKPIIENKQTNYGCMNCHSFCQQSPDRMLFHLRVDYGGTYVLHDGEVEKLETKTPETMSALVYPSWHPSGKYVAFSVNNTKQMFHTTDLNRIEVFDNASDVVVYDVDKHEIVSSPLLMSASSFETFPTFSTDGTKLYFCTADSMAMPAEYDQVRYRLCSIDFDPSSRQFGSVVDTLVGKSGSEQEMWSISFPRVSPKGDKLMFTRHNYGNFSIWHREADLYLLDLDTQEIASLDALNSDETESYHSWSSNGRWVVFSSRRIDGLYTRPFIAYIDKEGNAHKPFLLPQKDKGYYDRLMKSYNVPEFVKGEVAVSSYDLRTKARQPSEQISFKNQ